MDNEIIINFNPPFIRWKQKMSILMVTFVMIGVGLVSIPIVGYFNNKITFQSLIEIIASIGIIFLGLLLTYFGISTSYLTVYLKNHSIIIEKKIGFFRIYKKYELNPNDILTTETYEDDDGILWYHLVKLNQDKKTYILKDLAPIYYHSLQKIIEL